MKVYYKSSQHVDTKSDKMAYRYWFLFGSHHAYLNKWINQFMLWALLFAWLPLVFLPGVNFFSDYLGIFAIGLPALGILWLIADLILMPYYVRKYNEMRYLRKPRYAKSEPVQLEEDTRVFGYPITY